MQDIETVINSYEAEEERIVNVLSRKLEQVCVHLEVNHLLAHVVVYSSERRRINWNTF